MNFDTPFLVTYHIVATLLMMIVDVVVIVLQLIEMVVPDPIIDLWFGIIDMLILAAILTRHSCGLNAKYVGRLGDWGVGFVADCVANWHWRRVPRGPVERRGAGGGAY
ncbi:hypothetical protein [Mycobacterium haemophilum]|uniref:Uncharacterized protein n=1 Tax=Mycobacterium haemophilum TaxID=29311 RepID=A0A0I9U8W0_9MYCO|nr:hypothetical protein [Mycobacterium haemophilum]KLO32417.1 hypothetical protein ABH39_06975 [Mycobacterium haemophilum]KLO38631.1 hypothetical protein ABH38_04550 [Mycobacterium haemophilum]KLO44965.1 hypothetical protein ABH37_03445 [Mycobacterium haemophilum]KLO56309.1 hypothetical protein ABH36_03425 [Mycobacterium haemophilum]